MKILVVGASQGTGALAVKEALKRGHTVTAFARSPERIGVEHAQLTLKKGDFHRAEDVRAAVREQDAVLITAAPNKLKIFKEHPHYFSEGTRFAIDAMKEHGVKRLVVLSAAGTGNSRNHAPFVFDKILIPLLLKIPYQDHERQEALVMASDLDWVIARPTRLTDGAAEHRYKKEIDGRVPNSISRADVADFLVDAATSDNWLKKAVTLGG
ncbi:MAG TPA: SDR family oxidoreductase [Polyangiaceae bacterium]|jgi:putative NADH-flavin reductase